jgi:hypothetical protein
MVFHPKSLGHRGVRNITSIRIEDTSYNLNIRIILKSPLKKSKTPLINTPPPPSPMVPRPTTPKKMPQGKL